MRCWNCGGDMPKKAKICPNCESPAMPPPSDEEMAMAATLLEQMSPEALAQLQQTFMESDTADDFVNRIFVGSCPKCDSENTDNCENDPDINDLLVGRCFDCGQLWCTECEKLLKPGATVCDCLEDEEDD